MRMLRLEGGPTESPDFRLLQHFVALNLGDDVETELRIEDGPWFSRRFGHHFFVFIPAGVQHTARRLPNRVLLLEIGAQFAESVLRGCGDKAELRPLIAVEDSAITHILLALADKVRGYGTLEEVQTEALGAALLTRLPFHSARAPQPQPLVGQVSPRIHRVLEHVAVHLDSPPSLRSLAELAGMDVYRFVRAFKQSTGYSPHRYVLDARVAHAKELLRNQALSITEVAVLTGFTTPSHFSLTFRQVAGMSPRDYRRSLTR